MNRKSLLLSVIRATICLFVAGVLIVPAPRSVASAASTISLRSLRTGTNGAGATSLNLAKPTGAQLGDVLIAQIAINSSGTVITAPSGWHLILTTQSSTSFEEVTFYKAATASEPASYTWNFAAKHPATGAIDCFIGVDTARPIDASSGKYNSSTATVSFTQITTTAPNDMLLAFVAVSGNTTVTQPSGFAENMM